MTCEGKIVYTTEGEGQHEVGVWFVGLNEEEGKLLEKYTKLLEKKLQIYGICQIGTGTFNPKFSCKNIVNKVKHP